MSQKAYLASLLIVSLLKSVPAMGVGCDPCIQSAAQSAQASMEAAINTTIQAAEQNLVQTELTTEAVNVASQVITGAIDLETAALQQAIDMATKSILAQMDKATVQAARLTDHLTNSLTKNAKTVAVYEQQKYNERTFTDPEARPVSGRIGINRAEALRTARLKRHELIKAALEEMRSRSEPGNIPVARIREAQLDEDNVSWDITPLLQQKTLADEQVNDLSRLLAVMVNPDPKAPPADVLLATPAGQVQELERRVSNAQYEIVYGVLVDILYDRAPLIEDPGGDWSIGYLGRDTTEAISINEYLSNEATGRLSSEKWHQQVASLNQAGLLREQVYQEAIMNEIQYRLMEREEQALLLLGILLMGEK